MELKESLKQLRLLNHLYQWEIADMLGVHRTTYAYYEYGRVQPSIQTLLKLCEIYNVSLDYLVGRNRNK